MNLQLVDAIVQISQTLTPEEQQPLITQLNKSITKNTVITEPPKAPMPISKEQEWEIWRSLKNISSPSGKTDI